LQCQRGILEPCIEVALPCGKQAHIAPHRCGQKGTGWYCEVIKDAGDDPDITNGALIRATVKPIRAKGVVITGGKGVGRVTRPGLAIPPGRPAINPIPTKMLVKSLQEVLSPSEGVEVTISVEDGEELAQKTLNPRLGIVGGISILGTTGIVYPYSHNAYRESIRCAFHVAKAMGLNQVVLCTGKGSERGAQELYHKLPDAAFILMADYFTFAVEEAIKHNMRKIVIACFLGKLMKMASGAGCTHYKKSSLDLHFLADIAAKAGITRRTITKIRNANTARHALSFIPHDNREELFSEIIRLVIRNMKRAAGNMLRPEVLLLSYDGGVLFHAREDYNCRDRIIA
jgi:cobalt-precorrin-5B (C1)-methyltransferase